MGSLFYLIEERNNIKHTLIVPIRNYKQYLIISGQRHRREKGKINPNFLLCLVLVSISLWLHFSYICDFSTYSKQTTDFPNTHGFILKHCTD